MSTTQQQTAIGFLTDEMVSAGLPSDFNGTIVRARFLPYNYGGGTDQSGNPYKFVTAAALDIEPDEDSGYKPFTQYMKIANIDQFAPSQDNVNPVDLTLDTDTEIEAMSGGFIVPVGSKKGVQNSTNWAFWLTKLQEAGYPKDRLAKAVELGGMAMFDGLRAHFNRIEAPKRDGIEPRKGKDGKVYKDEVLVVTEILDIGGKAKPAVGAKKSPAGAKAAASPAPAAAAGNDEFEAEVAGHVAAAIAANGGSLEKGKLAQSVVLPNYKGTKQLPVAVQIVGKPAFLSGHTDLWLYDADSETLIGV